MVVWLLGGLAVCFSCLEVTRTRIKHSQETDWCQTGAVHRIGPCTPPEPLELSELSLVGIHWTVYVELDWSYPLVAIF